MAQLTLLLASVASAVAMHDAGDWRPLTLFWLLGGLAVTSSHFSLVYRGVEASAAFIAIILAAVLLGPLPAVVLGVVTNLARAIQRRKPPLDVLCNLSAFAAFSVTASALLEGAARLGAGAGPDIAVVVFAVFMATNLQNFLIVAVDYRVTAGFGIRRAFRTVYVPCLPVEVTSALLTGTIAFAYDRLGIGVVLLCTGVGLAFQYLVFLTFEARRKGEALEVRTQELASLQVGLLSTVLRTLAMRDKMTARHSAAVARYARAIATEIGLSTREQELVHTAALLHDIGKFVFPDSILVGNKPLTDDEYEIVKRHPRAGANLVESIEGYGPVAEIILAHHERLDGRGYPNGLREDEIPIGSRIIAVCDTYDVMTARDSYREPVSRADAIAELRRVSGSQLDGELVEVFIRLLHERGIGFRHTDDADFEHELDLKRRVREYAAPRIAA